MRGRRSRGGGSQRFASWNTTHQHRTGPGPASAVAGARQRLSTTPRIGTSPPADAVKEAAARFAEVKEYAGVLVAAKLDALKLSLRNVALYAVLGIVGGVVGDRLADHGAACC